MAGYVVPITVAGDCTFVRAFPCHDGGGSLGAFRTPPWPEAISSWVRRAAREDIPGCGSDAEVWCQHTQAHPGACHRFIEWLWRTVWSLVQMGAQGKLETTDLGVEGGDHGDDSDTVAAEDVDTGAYGRGRPRIEDPRRFGPDIVAFVEEFILGRGQRAVDGHRLSPTSGVFGAPLQAIVVAVEEYFGQKISKTGVRNLLAKARGDSHAAPRGVVNARPVRVVAGEKRPHPRARWSATLFKYDKQLVALLASRGVKVFQVHGDDMAKVPMVIPARPGSSPKGFVMQCEDGQAAFTQLDHSFPVAERMLLSTSGWVFCDVPSEVVELDGAKPQIRTGRPSVVHAFVRPTRYAPGSCKTHIRDLLDALERQGVAGSEVGLIGVDNGADYSVQSAAFQHYIFRIFRDHKMVLLIVDAQAPYHSAWHWGVEGQWPVPRRLIAGQAFGKFDHRRLEAEGAGREARLIEACNAAVRLAGRESGLVS